MALDRNDDRPPYIQIADQLAEAIRDGVYPDGHRIPSRSELMRQYGVASMTAAAAVQRLQQQGFVEPRQGLGVYVRFAPQRRVRGQQLTQLAAQIEQDPLYEDMTGRGAAAQIAVLLRELVGARPTSTPTPDPDPDPDPDPERRQHSKDSAAARPGLGNRIG